MKTVKVTVQMQVPDEDSDVEVMQRIKTAVTAALYREKMAPVVCLISPDFSTDFGSVKEFHNKFAVPEAEAPSLLGGEMYNFRVKFMKEELDEYCEATAAGDLLLAADALIDLSYVTLGTAAIMGLPWAKHFAEVQRANMSKERALRKGDSKRGSTFDVIKPEGWKAPDHSQFLGFGPYPVFNPKAN
jgi:predicted HAD superfamily Cof-like phosphohydrolase